MSSVYQLTELHLQKELNAAEGLYTMRLSKVKEYRGIIESAKANLKTVLCDIGLDVAPHEVFVIAELDDIDPKKWGVPIAYYPVIPGRVSVMKHYGLSNVEIVWHSKDISNGLFYNATRMIFSRENNRYDEFKAKLFELVFGQPSDDVPAESESA